MPDIDQWFGEPLKLSASGDLLLADGIHLANQRIVRRLMTVIGEYIWHPGYGASVPKRIGDELVLPSLNAIIRHQMYLDAAVARDPEPTITISPIEGGVLCDIIYINALTTEQEQLSFEVTR
ncbi:MAG: hypothetical protein ABL901_03010 [Hyphomicrobiaceae bacterium]|nr:phage tail protein [Hyphomicrobiaceae bacterium]